MDTVRDKTGWQGGYFGIAFLKSFVYNKIVTIKKYTDGDRMNKTHSYKSKTARRNKIKELLNSGETLRVVELSEQLETSVVTIRKDLDEMERDGLLLRVHGGAVKISLSPQENSYIERKNKNRDAKMAIAAAAAALVEEGESVLINVGSTCAYVCEALKDKQNLIIITNSAAIFNQLSHRDNLTLYFLGGRFDTKIQATVGDDVLAQLSKYTPNKLIVGMDGVDPVAGATAFDHNDDQIITRKMIAQARQRILVVDDSKIGKVAFSHVANLNQFDILITNYNPEKQSILEEIAKLGVKVITV